jgi:DUF4097 and DUF4098 domain-containing protein YvlB
MASYPPPTPPPVPPYGFDPRAQRRYLRDQVRFQREAARAQFRAQRDQLRYQQRSLRRSSILGPIVAIGLGVVFLLVQTGRLPHQRLWDWYGHWWPSVLVVAGLVLLAEWAFDQFVLRDPAALPYRRSAGGGVFTLLLIFAIAGVVDDQVHRNPDGRNWIVNGLHFDQDNLDEFLGDKHEFDQTLDLSLPAAGSLSVTNPRGDVTVSGTSDDNRIHIAVHKQVYSRTDSEADSKAQQFVATATTSGSAVTVSMPSLEGARADLVIAVPAAALATVTANRGDIHIAGIKSAVSATANHGDIELSAISGPATAHINSGATSLSAHALAQGLTLQGHANDITLSDIAGPVSISGEFFGTTHLEHIAGAVHFHTSRTDFQLARLDGEVEISPHADLSVDHALGPVVLTTSNRNITLDRVSGNIAVTNRNGTIDLTAAPNPFGTPLGSITLEDRNGTVTATLPERAAFTLQAATSDGNIDNDLKLDSQATPQADGRNRTSLNGSFGSNGPLVHISTSNGDINLHKASLEPIPANPPAPPKLTLVPPAPPAAPAHAAKPAKPAEPTN